MLGTDERGHRRTVLQKGSRKVALREAILRLCAEGCFESEKYEHVANARECDDYSFRTTGDAVTKCKIARGKDKFVCVRWICRSKFEVTDVARKAFQDVYAEVTAFEILRDFENGEKKVKKKSSVIKRGNRDDVMSISYSFGTLRDYGACEDFLCVATDWVDGVGLNAWRSNLGEYLKKDANEANNDRTLLLAIAKTMLQMVVDMHEKKLRLIALRSLRAIVVEQPLLRVSSTAKNVTATRSAWRCANCFSVTLRTGTRTNRMDSLVCLMLSLVVMITLKITRKYYATISS